MDRKIAINTVSLDHRETENVGSALASEMLSVGKFLDGFEEKLASCYKKNTGIMVNSGQSAIEVAVDAVSSHYADKIRVVVPMLTYLATIWGAKRKNTDLVFADIKMSDYGIDSESTHYNEQGEEVNKDSCEVVIPVDLFGKKCSGFSYPSAIIIEDACEAVGNWECNYGDLICLSFYSSHIISIGSGGMVLLNESDYASWIRSYIAHGRTHRGDFTKRSNEFSDRFVFDKYGQSLRGDNIHAAIGMAQLDKIEDIVLSRVLNAAKISLRLEKSETHLYLPNSLDNIFMFYPIVSKDANFKPYDLMRYLWEFNIDTRVMMPILSQPVFKEMYPMLYQKEMFPVADYCGSHGVLIPCHQNMSDDDIFFMTEKINDYFT